MFNSSALILAHPAHECLLYGFLRQHQPTVYFLSNGSGSSAVSRTQYSTQILEETGARLGTVGGQISDRSWYQAILDQNVDFFLSVQRDIYSDIKAANLQQIICDPVEHYNPLHDLANAMAHGIHKVRQATSPVASYPMMQHIDPSSPSLLTISLSPKVSTDKQRAILSYKPVKIDADGLSDLHQQSSERLVEDDVFDWPSELDQTPYYEEFGKKRIATGAYTDLIEYSEHVAPLGKALSAGLFLDGLQP